VVLIDSFINELLLGQRFREVMLPVSPFSTVPKPEQPVACFSLLSEIVHARLTRRRDVRRSRSTSKRKGKCQELPLRSKNAQDLMIKHKNHQKKCFQDIMWLKLK